MTSAPSQPAPTRPALDTQYASDLPRKLLLLDCRWETQGQQDWTVCWSIHSEGHVPRRPARDALTAVTSWLLALLAHLISPGDLFLLGGFFLVGT